MITMKTYGSFEYIADLADHKLCSEKCPQIKWLESPLGEPVLHANCKHFTRRVDRISGELVRTWECLAAEKHERERPAKCFHGYGNPLLVVCSNCGWMHDEGNPGVCKRCDKRMVSDGET